MGLSKYRFVSYATNEDAIYMGFCLQQIYMNLMAGLASM